MLYSFDYDRFYLYAGYATMTIFFILCLILFTSVASLITQQVVKRHYEYKLAQISTEVMVAQQTNRQLAQCLKDEKARSHYLQATLETAQMDEVHIFANMSHELLTPLNAVIGYSELLKNHTYGQLSSSQYDRVNRIYENGLRLSQHIASILDLCRLETVDLQLDFQPLSVQPLLDVTRARFAPKISEKALDFSINISPTLPSIYADTVKVQQVINHLVDNAVKFTDSGQISVSAKLVHELPSERCLSSIINPNQDWVLFTISDTGIGVAQEDFDHVFMNFTQLNTARNRGYSGMGIGLAIARRLVALHHGHIWMNSTLGQGSEFFVALPTVPETIALTA